MSTVTLSRNDLIILHTLAYGRVEEVKQVVQSNLNALCDAPADDQESIRRLEGILRSDYQYMCDLRALAGKLDVLIEERA